MRWSNFLALLEPMLQQDGGAAGGTSGGGSGGGGQGGQGGNKPFATFPDAASFHARVSRESSKQLDAKAKELGYDSAAEMEADIRTRKGLPPADGAGGSDRLAQLQANLDRQLQAVNQRLVAAEVKVAAAELGIRDADAAMKLMDAANVKVDDAGNVTGVKEALETLLKDKPYLKGAGGGPSKSGAELGAGGGRPPKLDMNAVIRRAARGIGGAFTIRDGW